ncbi:hypothetical protein [Microcystis phage Mel-JY01]
MLDGVYIDIFFDTVILNKNPYRHIPLPPLSAAEYDSWKLHIKNVAMYILEYHPGVSAKMKSSRRSIKDLRSISTQSKIEIQSDNKIAYEIELKFNRTESVYHKIENGPIGISVTITFDIPNYSIEFSDIETHLYYY